MGSESARNKSPVYFNFCIQNPADFGLLAATDGNH
jgi:hypothetical protein